MQAKEVTEIAELNDAFRRRGDGVTLTSGVQMMEDLYGLLEAVRWYDDFTGDNDPYGEHDFGSLVWHGNRIFWKLDYYDKSLKGWCDPLSPSCRRILTIMLASEY
jgi:hypothetical protein